MTIHIKKIKTIMVHVSLLIVITLLSITSLEKLSHFAIFRAQLKMSPWQAVAHNSIFWAWTIPFSELVVSLLLLYSGTRRWGFAGGIVLFAGFLIYMLWIWINKIKVSCGCNAFIEKLSVTQHVVFNLLLLLLSILGFLWMKRTTLKI